MISLRATALIAVASLGLHELRYVFGYGSHAHEALAAQGHGYLAVAGVVAAVLLALAAAQLFAALGRAWRAGVGEGAQLPFGLAWLAASLALAAVYSGQELMEGALSPGHPIGIAALGAHGGLVAYPLSLALGAIVALVLRAADCAVAAIARRARGPSLSRGRTPRGRPVLGAEPLRRAAFAAGRPVRGPPLPA